MRVGKRLFASLGSITNWLGDIQEATVRHNDNQLFSLPMQNTAEEPVGRVEL